MITIEQLLIAHTFIARIDEAMNHYDVRSIYTHQLGEALGNTFDTNVFRAVLKAARSTHVIYDTDTSFDGTVLKSSSPSMATDVATLKGAIYDAAQKLDEKDVPSDPRYLAVRPAQFYLLLEDGEFIHRDYMGDGSKARAKMPFTADLQVLKSNNIPKADDTANTAVPSTLRLDYTDTVAAVWHPSAAGTVKLLDLAVESAYDIRRQGSLFVAKFAIGQDILRAESAVELSKAV